MKLKKNKGVVFWITGLSGSGKTTLAELIYKFIDKTYGPTIIISGDDLRELFRLNKFDKISRLKYAQQYSYFCKTIVNFLIPEKILIKSFLKLQKSSSI